MIPTESILRQFEGKGVDPFPVKALGIRGYHIPSGQNQSNIYDDALCITDGEVSWDFAASVDPGRYWIQHPMNPRGCARMMTGLYWYKVGDHKGHIALVQAGGVDVERLSVRGEVVEEEKNVEIGANIHSGGDSEQVEKWSAGCQVIYSPEGAWGETWMRFIHLLTDMMVKHRQMRLPYLLVDKLKPLELKDL